MYWMFDHWFCCLVVFVVVVDRFHWTSRSTLTTGLVGLYTHKITGCGRHYNTYSYVCLFITINQQWLWNARLIWPSELFFVLISNPAVDNRCVCMCVCASNFILFNVFNSMIAICLFIWKFNGLMIFFLLYDDHSIWSILIAYRIDSIWQSFFIAIAFKFCFLCIFFPGVIRFIHSRQTKTIPGIYDYNMIIYR